MIRKSIANDYKADLLADLRNPSYAAGYVSAAANESPETLLLALRDLVEAQMGMTRVASEAGVNRENLYRMLSEEGNPRLTSLYAVLPVLGFKIDIVPVAPSVLSSIGSPEQTRFQSADIKQSIAQLGSRVQKASIAGFGTGKTAQFIALSASLSAGAIFSGSMDSEIEPTLGAESSPDISKKLLGQRPDESLFLPLQSAGGEPGPTNQFYK